MIEHQVIITCDECEQEWLPADTLTEAKALAKAQGWVLTRTSHTCAYCYDTAHSE